MILLKICFYIAATERAKKFIFHYVRMIPMVKKKIDDEKLKAKHMLEEDMNKCTLSLEVYSKLPKSGRSIEEVAKEAREYLKLGKTVMRLLAILCNLTIVFLYLGDCDWQGGALSGCVYNVDSEVTTLITEVYGLSAWTNPLHPDVFPGIRKMEAEIVQMGINMFNGGPRACGTVSNNKIYNV